MLSLRLLSRLLSTLIPDVRKKEESFMRGAEFGIWLWDLFTYRLPLLNVFLSTCFGQMLNSRTGEAAPECSAPIEAAGVCWGGRRGVV